MRPLGFLWLVFWLCCSSAGAADISLGDRLGAEPASASAPTDNAKVLRPECLAVPTVSRRRDIGRWLDQPHPSIFVERFDRWSPAFELDAPLVGSETKPFSGGFRAISSHRPRGPPAHSTS